MRYDKVAHTIIRLPRSGIPKAAAAHGDLAAAIYATIEHDVESIFGDSITAINEHPDGVCVSFAQAKTRDFDLVIGADGLHSNVRRLTLSPESDVEHYLGCLVAACVVERYRPLDDLAYVTHSEPGRSVGRFSLRGDRLMFLFVFRSHQAADPGELAARKALLRHEFANVGWECPADPAALQDVDDLYFDVVSQIRLDRWWRRRAVLTGDAAACVSLLAGEGTGLAMTEAYVLAGELLCAGGDYRRAFDIYEARLRCFVEGKQASAPVHWTLIREQQVGAVVDQRGESDRVDRDQGYRIGRRDRGFGSYRRSRHGCRMIRFGAHC